QHGTLAQAHFYLASRGQDIAGYEQAHEQFQAALAQVLASIPPDRRRAMTASCASTRRRPRRRS
ncbi:MAG: hypothetical protein KKA73_03840, partial [Chloroflexi bacterium]|nr:hypothetical protein [Chloroflexota bacterium]